jgi:hypothetical protein
MIKARTDISGTNAALNNTKAMNGTSGVVERVQILESKGFAPAACSDGTTHWVFVVGTDQACWYKVYSGSWGSWTSLHGAFSSGLTAYCFNNGTHTLIWVYGQGLNNQLWQRTWSGTAWDAAWVDLGGNID